MDEGNGITEGAVAKRQMHRAPAAGEWNYYRSTIVRLYLDEEHSLQDVMSLMKVHYNFSATYVTLGNCEGWH